MNVKKKIAEYWTKIEFNPCKLTTMEMYEDNSDKRIFDINKKFKHLMRNK